MEIFFSQPSKKYVSKEESVKIIKEAQPFLTWLAEAEEDSDDDSEDQDDEVEVRRNCIAILKAFSLVVKQI